MTEDTQEIFYHFTSKNAASEILADGFHHEMIWLADDPKLALGYHSGEILLEVRVRNGRKAIAMFEQKVNEEVLNDAGEVVDVLESQYSFWEVPGDVLNFISNCRIVSNHERQELMI